MPRLFRLCAILLLLAAPLAAWVDAPVGAAPASPAQPNGGTVGNGTSGSCTDAELHAKVPGGGLVTFNCGGPKTIDVDSLLFITEDTTINGGGVITLTGGMGTRLFVVNSGVKLTLSGLVLDNFYGAGQHGGAIANHGTLSMTAVTVQNSLTDFVHAGGAIYSDGQALTIHDSVFTNNRAGSGGAIFADTGPVQIRNTRFVGNYTTDASEGYGGAIYIDTNVHMSYRDGQMAVNSSLAGGALFMARDSVVTLESTDGSHQECLAQTAASLTQSPQACASSPQIVGPPNYTELDIFGNTAAIAGGAIYNGGGQLTTSGIDILQNTVPITAETYGGGIANYGTLNLLNTYLLINQAAYGGGLYAGQNIGSGPSTVVIDDGYLAVNQAENGGGLYANKASTVITVTDTLFLLNEGAGTAGGGLFRYNARLSLYRSAFIANSAALGGAIFDFTQPENPGIGGTVLIRDTTISTNTTTFLGGAILNADLLQLTSVTLVDNGIGLYTSSTGQTYLRSTVLRNALANCTGDHGPVDSGHNYATDLSCGFTTSTQGDGLDPLLGPLTSGSDPLTYFHIPQALSPLANAGPADCASLDQRGMLRLDTCDIGAIERDGRPPKTYLPFVKR